MDYFERIKFRLDGKEPNVPAYLGDKAAVRSFARTIGVTVPALYHSGPVSSLNLLDFPEVCVVKPRFSSTSIGVRLLARKGNSIHDYVTGEPVDFDELITKYRELSKARYGDENRGEFFVEELVEPYSGSFPPPDVRCYMFQGEVGFHLVEDHILGKASASYFDPGFEQMENRELRFGVAQGAEDLEEIVKRPAPERAEELEMVARRISYAIPTAFCRVDLYDSPKGVYLGELTFFPGTFYYKNRKIMHQVEADRLGKMWGEAFRRLKGSEYLPAPKG